MALLFFQILLCFSCYIWKLALGYNASDPIWETKFDEHKHDVVAFYHIWANEGTNYHSIVEQQLDVLDNSGLFDKLEKIFYSTSGDKGKFFRIQNPKFQFLSYLGNDGEEYETLGLLHRFCHAHPKTKVLYFHDRHEGNSDFRGVLDCFVLNPECLDALNTGEFDTCGWRLSPVPFVHYFGNFWWAQCHYVNKLIDPLVVKTNSTFINAMSQLSDCVGMHEKSFAEAWIGSAPMLKPADCMNGSIDSSYLFGYKVPPVAHYYCPNEQGKYGSTCDVASAHKYPDLFSVAYNMHKMQGKQECQRDLDSEIEKRSMVMYGESAKFSIDLNAKLKNLRKFKDGTAVRAAHQKQVYYVKDNCLHPIPNAGVFGSLGLSWDNVEAIPDYQLSSYQICGSM